ncbi:TPA: hypothetical protein ACFI5T_000097 [Neisseria gonorrhoeae]
MQTKSLSIIRDNGKLSIVIPAKAGILKTKSRRNLSERTEPQKPASHLRLNNRTKKAEIKTSGFFFKLAIKHQNE